MVWSRIPVYWAEGQLATTLRCERRLNSNCSEEIRRDRDKASVVLWSIANETPLARRSGRRS